MGLSRDSVHELDDSLVASFLKRRGNLSLERSGRSVPWWLLRGWSSPACRRGPDQDTGETGQPDDGVNPVRDEQRIPLHWVSSFRIPVGMSSPWRRSLRGRHLASEGEEAPGFIEDRSRVIRWCGCLPSQLVRTITPCTPSPCGGRRTEARQSEWSL